MNDILKILIYIFICIGIGCTVIVIYYELLKQLMNNLGNLSPNKSKRAKCCCIDCIYHGISTNICYKRNLLYTNDTWFCHDAEPRTFIDEKDHTNRKR